MNYSELFKRQGHSFDAVIMCQTMYQEGDPTSPWERLGALGSQH